MDLERLRIWRDALVRANAIGRPFGLGRWRDFQQTRGTICCPGGDLAMDPVARDLGVTPDQDGCPEYLGGSGVDAIFAFLKIEDVSRDERIWVRRVIGAAKKNALYVPQSGKPLPWAGVTREMVIGAIEEKIKALETA